MTKLMLAVVTVLAACGGTKAPAPTEPTAPSVGAMTPEACTEQGGQVRGDIGDGKIACAEGETELGRVSQGIEGAVCCRPATP